MNIIDFLIDESITVLQAMQKLGVVAKKVLFVTRDNKFIASITDGDIRRWILKGGSLDTKVKNVANYSPKTVSSSDKHSAKALMKKYSIEAIPVVDNNGQIVSVALWNDLEIKKETNLDLPVVIMAGGLGTRLYPYTKILPKPLIPIGEIPIVEHIINKFNTFGITNFHLIVNHKKNMIKAYFNEIEKDYNVYFTDEDTPLGTGGGLSLLKDEINDTFILSNCDILIEEDYEAIYNHHKSEKNTITMICSLKTTKIPYGVVEIGQNGEIESMREKPELSFFTNTGVYICESSVIKELEENKSIGFPDIIESYMQKGQKVGVYPINENSWMDMGEFDKMDEMRDRLYGK